MKNTDLRRVFLYGEKENQHQSLSCAGCGFLRVAAGRMGVEIWEPHAADSLALSFILSVAAICCPNKKYSRCWQSYRVQKSCASICHLEEIRKLLQSKNRSTPFWVLTSYSFLSGSTCMHRNLSMCLLTFLGWSFRDKLLLLLLLLTSLSSS